MCEAAGLTAGTGGMTARRQRTAALAWVLVLFLLSGCAGLPSAAHRPESHAIPVDTGTALGKAAKEAAPGASGSGFRLLFTGSSAWHARIELANRAQHSLDLQYYHIKGDETGRLLLRSLRDAALRGVRVRLLLDDLHTSGEDELLLGLAAHDNVEVRLFNPFPAGRGSLVKRFAASLLDFRRVHRRMHNKMFVADGAMAIVGGRNVANEYYLLDAEQSFFDLDILTVGKVLAQLQGLFDQYWNSRHAHAAQSIVVSDASKEQLRERFSRVVDGPDTPQTPAPPAADPLGYRPLAAELQDGKLRLHWGAATAFADSPDKIVDDPRLLGPPQPDGPYGPISSMRLLVVTEMAKVREEMTVTSPYQIPGEQGMKRIRDFRMRGMRIRILTNSLASTDQPFVHTRYRRYRTEMLRAGVELYELSPVRGKRLVRELFRGHPVFRLHSKSVVFDQKGMFIGSMNLDPRSEQHNTEMGLLIESPELARDVLQVIESIMRESAYQVRLLDDGGLEWVATDESGVERLRDEPESGFWGRFLLELLAPFIPEGML